VAPAAPAKANESNEAEESVAQVNEIFDGLCMSAAWIKYDQIISNRGQQRREPGPRLGMGYVILKDADG